MNDRKKIVLIQGCGHELTSAVASALLRAGAVVALDEPGNPAQCAALAVELADRGEVLDLTALLPTRDDALAPLKLLHERFGSVDAVIGLYMPDASSTGAAFNNYARELETSLFAIGEFMARIGSKGVILNQFVLSTLFADHALAPSASAARGALAALTRVAAVRFGKAGVRVLGLLVGLLDLPALKAIVSERVRQANTPLGRWISAADVAETIAFFTLESGYVTGQMLVLDGGMTSGVNGL